ncbi:MAG: peptidylprolyl isomerase [Planctomycetota bacterium]
MHRLKFACLMLAAGAALVSGVGTAPAYDQPKQAQGQVIARINGEIITDRQVSAYIKQFQLEYKAALQELIDNQIILQAAVKAGIKVDDREIDEAFKERTANVRSTEELITQVLEPLKLSLEEFRRGIADDLVRQRYIHSKIGAPPQEKEQKVDIRIDIFVPPREIKEYFAKHRNELVLPGKIKTRQIILKYDRQTKDLKKAAADSILKELKNGADFAELAKKRSDIKAESGGDWNWTDKSTFPKEVEDIIYNLEIGSVSPVIETSNNYRIIKVEGKNLPKEPSETDPDTQQAIRKILVRQKIDLGIDALKTKLRQESDIQLMK